MSTKYYAIAAMYSTNYGKQGAISKGSSQYACTRAAPRRGHPLGLGGQASTRGALGGGARRFPRCDVTMRIVEPHLRVWKSFISSSGTRMWRGSRLRAPCGAVLKALETSKARIRFSSCPRYSLPCQEHRGCRRSAWHGPELPPCSHPLTSQAAVNLRMRGVISLLMSRCPNPMGLYATKSPVVVPLEIGQMMASCDDSETFAPRSMAR